uniref:Uncharacterized protein n=1 Tax=Arundo donax TaxID=35708 RepID=A0A0A9EZG1_ARUDO
MDMLLMEILFDILKTEFDKAVQCHSMRTEHRAYSRSIFQLECAPQQTQSTAEGCTLPPALTLPVPPSKSEARH